MTTSRALLFGLAVSFAVHLGALTSPGWLGNGDDVPKNAARLMAEVRVARSAEENQAPAASPSGATANSANPAPRRARARKVEPVPPEADSAPVESAPVASAPTPEAASEAAPEAPAEEAIASASAPAESATADELAGIDKSSEKAVSRNGETTSAASRLVRSGRIRYVGYASILAGEGEVFWTHDGTRLISRLAAGLRGQSPMFTYESVSSVGGALVVSKTTHDNRRGKVSESQIDLATDVVTQQRGDQTRTKQITGAAVALSALPQFLATIDQALESAAIFIVGDFWVEDSVVVNRGMESVELDSGRLEARHFQSHTKDGKDIDIWLAPAWHNAPVRIRIKAGASIDLRAADVEVDGQHFAKAGS